MNKAIEDAARSFLGMNAPMLERYAAAYPRRTFHGARGPYLSRYTLAELADGGRIYLHFFHRGDEDRELHNHPWNGTSLVLTGGYREERREGEKGAYRVIERTFLPGDMNELAPDTFHRVDLLDPAGCWTFFSTSTKSQSWGFWDRDTDLFVPWRDWLTAKGLPTEPT